MAPTRAQLLKAAQALCDDFAAKKDLDALLAHFSTTHQATAVEHGEPCLAPFLGRPFTGHDSIRKYFQLLQEHLSYEDMRFSEWVVDAEAGRVAVKGQADFTWTATQEAWSETFHYALDFDEELKVTDYQVWADSGAAYLARKGRLSEERKADTK
ncbi:hypothetical protein GLOTRDRAFT_138102 [Gloeophyllum trabeum ATCC 11539]|uniref:SnoaL-like domain-containing protein n=1 Tax=Gloeophyllum trabeum (strain ATCC 11539 / FP-39264 / Madison 617) TaxID=670483 RepID=S7RP79_GLOTA|nr:uncharacterized protein GLOTRDRAFT_138102 [Gloeophyllum trabeum ATCC 11539]EPQ56345.1 hypothetical protein GLOTRDRAFT_138102 [Gloeophyllum trabeum ATCC 11539]